MYDPKGNGKERSIDRVRFVEARPPKHLSGIIHRYLEIYTENSLAEEYQFHALPDACTYLIFDQLNIDVAGVTRLKASSEELSLGKSFHFVNVRFLPGVWQHDLIPVSYGLVKDPYQGDLPLQGLNNELKGLQFSDQQNLLSEFVEELLKRKLVKENIVTQKIFEQLEDIHSVADMAEVAELSARQLQRVLKASTGFAPHDFLKVLRLQQSLLGEPSLSYADQSHFIHSFKKATGYTPARYSKKFDV
ncbi:AraC family transcriptional regulator [Curvivirga sp.]|uniref:AraC family transcriptional regulator n=1 Tax=Curvivirga sp. TaxID=2856848 RepID=UPI003B5B62AD